MRRFRALALSAWLSLWLQTGSSGLVLAKPVGRAARAARTVKPEVSGSEAQLLRIRRVVIDAGHGGKDFGALGVHGLREKDINLSIANRLGQELKRRLGVKVIYTRTSDRFVSLSRRARIANESNADLFISIHANAHASETVSGVETYYLDTTSDNYSARIAQRENTGNWLGSGDLGLPQGDLGRDVKLILADLAMRSASTESRRLASYVQSTLVDGLRKKARTLRDLGVKHALFYVLLGVRMPSVLVETGFVTHPNEAKRLADPRYGSSVATAIAQGVCKFVDEREWMMRRLAAEKSDLHRPALASLKGG